MQVDRRRSQRAAQSEPLDLRVLVRDLLAGEVAAPTEDVRDLIRGGVDPDDFYTNEIAPSWDGLGEAQRAARLEGFLELSALLDGEPEGSDVPAEMGPAVRTRMLVLAWAFDETYGYISRLARGEFPTAADRRA